MFNRNGEISTIVILGTLVVIGVAALFSSTATKEKTTTDAQAADGCPITKVELSGSTCKVTINFTPGDPEPAAPRNLVCALINPARDGTIPNNQLVAGQGTNTGLDFFNKSTIGQFPLKSEANFTEKLQPVPSDGNYNLVAYDFTNPGGCLKEIKVSTAAAQAVGNAISEPVINTATPVLTTQAGNANPTSVVSQATPTVKPTIKPTVTNAPTPVKTCTSPLQKCPNANLCVPALAECPDVTNTPTQTPSPTEARLENGLPIPPISPIIPRLNPKPTPYTIKTTTDLEVQACIGEPSVDEPTCVDIYGFYVQ